MSGTITDRTAKGKDACPVSATRSHALGQASGASAKRGRCTLRNRADWYVGQDATPRACERVNLDSTHRECDSSSSDQWPGSGVFAKRKNRRVSPSAVPCLG